jgi:hypothetical protein
MHGTKKSHLPWVVTHKYISYIDDSREHEPQKKKEPSDRPRQDAAFPGDQTNAGENL